MQPHLGLKNAIFWSTIFYAFAGCETGSFMSEEIKDARRSIPRALIISGIVLAVSYIAGTIAMLIALPSSQISGVGGFVSAVQVLCMRLGVPWLVTIIAGLIAVSSIGGAAVFLSSTSRLPFVAGIDSYLPRSFGLVHPQWGTPWIAIIVYGAAGMLCAVLGQLGSSVAGAYDLLVSMSIITYFIPFVFLFLAMIRLQREPAPADVMRLPGGKPVAITLATTGLITTVFAIVLSAIPSDDEPHKVMAIARILGSTLLMIGAGAVVFWNGKRRQQSTPSR
jgi:amino acid transporter